MNKFSSFDIFHNELLDFFRSFVSNITFLGKNLDPKVAEAVVNFYKDEEISATMPGKKDVILFKNNQGIKTELQKRLLLGTLRELYATFKERHSDLKVGFTSFSLLRPRECVFARSCGTHTICVCTTHQNVKLSILGKFIIYIVYAPQIVYNRFAPFTLL